MTDDWTPPFCTKDDSELDCPKCNGTGTVRVREKEFYCDTDTVDAYCAECHVLLEVTACVDIAFADPEIVGEDES